MSPVGELTVGHVVAGRYEIRGPLEDAPAFRSYRAYDREVEVEVALWALRSELFPDVSKRAGFLGCVVDLRGLSHPNVLRMFDAGEDGQLLFATAQLHTDDRLLPRPGDGRVATDTDLMHYATAVGDALDAAHAAGYLHGRLVPTDIVHVAGLMKVSGIGLYLDVDLVASRSCWLTYERFVAPEVLSGGVASPGSDVYSLAAVLAELALGKTLDTTRESLAALRLERPGVADALMPALSMAVDLRPQSAGGLVARLRTTLDVDLGPSSKTASPSENRHPSAEDLEEFRDDMASQMGLSPGDVVSTRRMRKVSLGEVEGEGESGGKGRGKGKGRVFDSDGAPDTVVDPHSMPDYAPPPPVPDVPPVPGPHGSGDAPRAATAFERPGKGKQKKRKQPETLPGVGEVGSSSKSSGSMPLIAPPSGEWTPVPDDDDAIPTNQLQAISDPSAVPVPVEPRRERSQPVIVSHKPKTMPGAKKNAPRVPAIDRVRPKLRSIDTGPVSQVPAGRYAPPRSATASKKTASSLLWLWVLLAILVAGGIAIAVILYLGRDGGHGAASRAAGDAAPVHTGPAPETVAMQQPDAAPKGPCAKGMVLITGDERFCIDAYEDPGVGRMPAAGISLAQAEDMCKARNARLCTGDEWETACRGEGGSSWPYGSSFRREVCNVKAGRGSVGPAGSFAGCRSAAGVFDMSGNVAEWVKGGTVRGGSSEDRSDGRCSRKQRRHGRGESGYADVGFRCCTAARR